VDYQQETLALCMPVYDKVHHKAWEAHMRLAIHLGSIFPPSHLSVLCSHKLPQPHAQNYLMNSVLTNRLDYGVTGSLLGPESGKARADWILWVEDDTTPPENTFELLRQHADPKDRPVIHGISYDRMPPHGPSIWRVNPADKGKIEPIWDWKDNTLYRIAHSGTCVVLMHVSTLERMQRPWFRMQPFEPGCQGMIPCLSFSRRMHEANIPIYAYTGCEAGHIGESVEIRREISRAMGQRLCKTPSM